MYIKGLCNLPTTTKHTGFVSVMGYHGTAPSLSASPHTLVLSRPSSVSLPQETSHQTQPNSIKWDLQQHFVTSTQDFISSFKPYWVQTALDTLFYLSFVTTLPCNKTAPVFQFRKLRHEEMKHLSNFYLARNEGTRTRSMTMWFQSLLFTKNSLSF